MSRTLVISDIHGAFRALAQVMERAKFNPDTDKLICLGDCVDGYPEVTECIQFLNDIPNLIYILGNHDSWTLRWLGTHLHEYQWGLDPYEYRSWVEQGGRATINSMEKHNSHREVFDFLTKAKYYHEENHKLFVHGGIKPFTKAEDNDESTMIWDRKLIEKARMESISLEPVCPEYDFVFIGHSPVSFYNRFEPTIWNNVVCCDCGASYPGMDGRLGMIDVDTKEVWVSDQTKELYPGVKAR